MTDDVERTMMASRFKAECLAVLDQVQRMKITVTVTKHGKPIARVVPLEEDAQPIMGSVRLVTEDDAAYFTTGEDWSLETRAG